MTFSCSISCSLRYLINFLGAAEEAIHMYRTGLQVIKESKYAALDDALLEKMRIDLAELLHITGRLEFQIA